MIQVSSITLNHIRIFMEKIKSLITETDEFEITDEAVLKAFFGKLGQRAFWSKDQIHDFPTQCSSTRVKLSIDTSMIELKTIVNAFSDDSSTKKVQF